MTSPDGCCVPEEDMIVGRDYNMNVPFKGGNQYFRLCPECGSRKFTTRSYWENSVEQYVIPSGYETPVQRYDCPYEGCDGYVREPSGQYGSGAFPGDEVCPDCGGEIEWQDESSTEDTDDEQTETQEEVTA